jgi:C4-dicarboxylate transporter, DctM subunit
MDLILLFGVFLLLLFIGLPISLSMGVSAFVFLLVTGQHHMLIQLPNRMVLASEHYGLMAIPFFYLAGSIMVAGGLTQRLIDFSRTIIGHITGSLSLINVIASMVFAGVSGSCVADTSAIGSVLIPAMKKDGYPSAYAAAVTGATSTIGHIIPPSIPMILIGVLVELPIGNLFLAGAIPGILLGLSMLLYCYIIAKKRGYPRTEKRATVKEMFRAFFEGILVLVTPAIVVGGVVFGIVTVTETGILTVIYALFLSILYKEFSFSKFADLIRETAQAVANLLMIIATAGFFGWVMVNTGVGDNLVELILSISTNKFVVLTLLIVFLLVIGCVLDVLAMVFIFTPVMIPLVQKVGIDPFHFSAVFVLALGIALLTPPMGLILYLVKEMSESTLSDVMWETFPLLIVQFVVLLLVAYVPVLSTWLPSLL